jgi:NAD(P)-dependent dehydrogenase (short-subunit alcohol dehydrogenase family)
MKHEQYASVIASKVQGAWNVYHTLPVSQLDFFIAISSAAGAVGNRGQAAYAAANTFLNGFAQYLRHQGVRSAASIDLTAVSDAGYLAEELESCNGHPITGMRITPTLRPFWTSDAKFIHLRRAAEAASTTPAAMAITWSAAYKAATSQLEAEQVVCRALVEKIAQVISMEPEELDIRRSISHYPLDSLTAIEVRNFITRMFEANLQVLELLASGSIESLAKIVCTKSKIAIA